MEPTVAQVITRARTNYLGAGVSVFPDAYLLAHVQQAFDEMKSVFKVHQIPDTLIVTPFAYTVVAPTAEIDPVVAVWSGFGDLQLLEERPTGSTDAYTPMQPVDILSQRDPTDKIREYTQREGKIQFVTPTGSVDVRAHYFASGNGLALTSGTIAVDDCLNFLAASTAASAGGPKGYTQEATEARNRAYGPNNHNPLAILGGFLQMLVESKLRVLQQTPVVPARFRAGGFR